MITNINDFTLDIQLFNKTVALPDDLKKEVADFAAFLKQKSKAKKQI